MRDPDFKARLQAVLAMQAAHGADDVDAVLAQLAARPEVEAYGAVNGMTWLHFAASKGHAALVDFWLAREIDPNANAGEVRPGEACAPLHQAANAVVARRLIESGARVDAWYREAGTPLHAAVITQRPDVIRALLDAGADPAIVNGKGRTPLAMAIFLKKRKPIEQLLRDANAPLDGHPPADARFVTAPPPIDLRADLPRIRTLIDEAIATFVATHPLEIVTAFCLAASGIEGYVMIGIDTGLGPHHRAFDATYDELATATFDNWRLAYQLGPAGARTRRTTAARSS